MELSTQIEGLLFVADAPLTLNELYRYLNSPGPDANADDSPEGETEPQEQVPTEAISGALGELRGRYADPRFAFELREVAGGYQLVTKASLAPLLKQAMLVKENKRLSRSLLEALSIVAYKQPVTRAEVEFIRGVGSDYVLSKLQEKQLIEPAGRAELPGKPMQYRTTPYFMEYFGLRSLDDLPRLEELQEDEEAVSDEFRTFLEEKEAQHQPELPPNAE